MAVTRSDRPKDNSEMQWRHTDHDNGPPYTLHMDVWISRRKRFHMITDTLGGVQFRSRLAGDMLNWLAERRQFTYSVVSEGDSYQMLMRPEAEKKEED